MIDYKVDWRPEWHRHYPRRLRTEIHTIMLLTLINADTSQPRFPSSQVWQLPTEMLFAIFSALVCAYRPDFVVGYPTSIVSPEGLVI